VRPLRLLFAGCFSVLAAGCARELPFEDRVVHLDLRLADGRSSAQELAGSAVTWTERLELAGPDTDLGPWSVLYCRVDAVPNGKGGMSLSGIVPDGTRMKRVELRSARTYAADEVDFLELELARTSAGIARVSWASSLDLEDRGPFPRSTTTYVPAFAGRTTLRIPLSTQPGWIGDISEISVAPKEDGVQRFDLLAVRLGRVGFTPGPDAHESAPSGPGQESPGLDGGLIAMGRETRRAFPSDWNVPLFASARVPRGGRLSVEAGVSTNTINLTAEVRFVVDARAAATEPWQRVGSTSIVPGMRAQGPAWEHLSVSLESFEGRDVELRFVANADDDPTDGGTLARARLYWGEPLILPALGPGRRPNVVLITLDTVRADALGAYATSRAPSPTPFLDSLAARGILFENAWSACNATSPSHASLMTGLAVQDHGLFDNRSRLAPENVTLAERFREAGWQTVAAVSVPHLTPDRSGLGQGFDRVWLGQADSAGDGAKTVAAVREWWRAFVREGPRPTFLWLHLFDAHTPYDVPAWFLEDYEKRLGVAAPPRVVTPATLPATGFGEPGGFLAGVDNVDWPDFMYRAAVAYQDELLRQLFSEWRTEFGAEHTFVAVVADHGEALGEHDNWYRHTGLYREVMHVPLIVAPPGRARGLRVSEPVWSLDLARTLFGVSGAPVPSESRGVDLLEFAAGTVRPQRRIFFEHSNLAQVGAADEEHTAIYTEFEYLQFGRDRAVAADTLQLFDARSDPAQKAELREPAAELRARYRALFGEWRAGALDRSRLKDELSEDEERELRQLGY
jgi:arylsulfatase A-like enzyme